MPEFTQPNQLPDIAVPQPTTTRLADTHVAGDPPIKPKSDADVAAEAAIAAQSNNQQAVDWNSFSNTGITADPTTTTYREAESNEEGQQSTERGQEETKAKEEDQPDVEVDENRPDEHQDENDEGDSGEGDDDGDTSFGPLEEVVTTLEDGSQVEHNHIPPETKVLVGEKAVTVPALVEGYREQTEHLNIAQKSMEDFNQRYDQLNSLLAVTYEMLRGKVGKEPGQNASDDELAQYGRAKANLSAFEAQWQESVANLESERQKYVQQALNASAQAEIEKVAEVVGPHWRDDAKRRHWTQRADAFLQARGEDKGIFQRLSPVLKTIVLDNLIQHSAITGGKSLSGKKVTKKGASSPAKGQVTQSRKKREVITTEQPQGGYTSWKEAGANAPLQIAV